MKVQLVALLLLVRGASMAAQAPAAATDAQANDLGFTFTLPSDWEVVNSAATLPEVKEQAQQNATTEDEKKGLACVQIAQTVRHGDPASVVVVVGLPFNCFGQTMSVKDLPGFAQGASEGIKQSFDITDPVYGEYTLGSHSMWIERAKGSPKGHPETPYTVEISCTLLKKGAVCWMALAADEAALKVFEKGAVTLDGESPAALVPTIAFDKKPPS
jgi:hypothetical protein